MKQKRSKFTSAKRRLSMLLMTVSMLSLVIGSSPVLAADSATVSTAKQNLTQAETALSTAQKSYDAALSSAKKAVSDAKTAYQKSGEDFLDSVTVSSHQINAYKKLVKNSTDSQISSTYNESKLDAAFAPDVLLEMSDLLDTNNKYRAADDNFTAGSLKLSPDLVVESTFSAMVSYNTYAHVMFGTSDTSIQNAMLARAENLAWGYSDPFSGWIVEEKQIYDTAKKNGSSADYSDVGHYLNAISSDYDITGFGHLGYVHAQRLSSNSSLKSYTSTEWRNAVTNFTASYKAKLSSANSSLQKIQNKDTSLSVVQKLKAAQTKVTQAKAALARAQEKENEKKTTTYINQTLPKGKSDADPASSTYRNLALRQKKVTKNSIKIGWKKVSGSAKYIIYGAKCGSAYKKISTVKGTSFTQKSLKKGTYYKYVVYAVKSNGTVAAVSKAAHIATTGGKVGNHTKIRLNKTKITLKRNKTFTLKATAKKGKLTVKNHRKVKYESSNTAVAKVSASGKIRGVKKGTCSIYAYAQNGIYARIKVTVK